MDGFDALDREPAGDAGEPADGAAPPALRLGAQTLDAARGVNRHHELRMARHYARLAQAVETPPDASSTDAAGDPA